MKYRENNCNVAEYSHYQVLELRFGIELEGYGTNQSVFSAQQVFSNVYISDLNRYRSHRYKELEMYQMNIVGCGLYGRSTVISQAA